MMLEMESYNWHKTLTKLPWMRFLRLPVLEIFTNKDFTTKASAFHTYAQFQLVDIPGYYVTLISLLLL